MLNPFQVVGLFYLDKGIIKCQGRSLWSSWFLYCLGIGVPSNYSQEGIEDSWEWKGMEEDNSGVTITPKFFLSYYIFLYGYLIYTVLQVTKWMLSKGQGRTMGTYFTLLNALAEDERLDEVEELWTKLFSENLESMPRIFFDKMISIYYRRNMYEKIFEVFSIPYHYKISYK